MTAIEHFSCINCCMFSGNGEGTSGVCMVNNKKVDLENQCDLPDAPFGAMSCATCTWFEHETDGYGWCGVYDEQKRCGMFCLEWERDENND